MELSELLKKARKDNGLEQVELAEKVGVSRVSVIRYQTGDAEPKPEVLVKLCHVLKIPPMDMAKALEEDGKKAGQDLGQKKAEQFLDAYNKEK